MKRIAMLSALLFMPLVAAAQDATLFNDEIDHGGYGALVTKVTTINGEAAFMLGAEGVWLIDKSIYVGVQGSGIVNKVDANTLQPNGNPYLMWVNEAGVRAGYIHKSDDLVHFSAGALVGAGSMQLADRYPWTDPAKVETYDDQVYYFLVEPEIAAELNVASWMRTRIGASYRIVTGVDDQGMKSGDLAGPAGSLTFMFGSF